jgi:hypothetical protein
MLNCHRCEKVLYDQDKLGPVNGRIYHKTCFKCRHCDTLLTLKSYKTSLASINDKEVYCTAHAPKAVGLNHYLQSQRSFVNGTKQSKPPEKVTVPKTKEHVVANRAKFLQNCMNFQEKSKQEITQPPKARIIRDTVGAINYKKYMEVIKRNNSDLKVGKLVAKVDRKKSDIQENPVKENPIETQLKNELNFYESYVEPKQPREYIPPPSPPSQPKSIESSDFESLETPMSSISSPNLSDGLGRIMISYRFSNDIFVVTIHKAECLVSPTDETLDTYVRVMLIPDPSKISLCKSVVRENTLDPVWDESFGYQISLEDVRQKYIYLSVKDHKMDTELLSTGLQDDALKLLSLGEALIPLDDTQESMLYEIWYKLQKPSDVQELILNYNI